MQNLKSRFHCLSFRSVAAIAGATLLAVFAPVYAHAALTVSLSTLSNVAAGSTGNSFDVLLTNTSSSSVSIDAFSFGVTSSSSDVMFTDATTSTSAAPYIFDGFSLFGPDIIGPGSTATDISASDIGLSSISLAPLGVVALGHVLFNVLPGAPTETVTFALDAFPGTSLSDQAGVNIPIGTLTGGRFEILGAAPVPEPSSLLLLLAGVPVALKWRRTRH